MEVAEGLNILIDWSDRYASNERSYKLYFNELNDIKFIINDMKKATRVASKEAKGIIAIFTTLNMGYGNRPIDLNRYNLDVNDLSMTKIFYEYNVDILNPKKESEKFETIYEMVNYAFKDIDKELKKIIKEQKKIMKEKS